MSDDPFAPPVAKLEPAPDHQGLDPVIAWIQLQSADLVRPQLRWFFRRPWVWLMVLLSSLWAVLQLRTAGGVFAGLVPLVLVLAMAGSVAYGAKERFKRLTKAQKKLEYRFTSDHFEIGDQSSSSQVGWSSIHHFEEQADAFLVFISDGLFHVVPKRAFASKEELDLARRWLLAKLPERAASERGLRAWVLFSVFVLSLLLLWQLLASPRSAG